MEYPWHTQRAYNSYSAYFKKLFGVRVQKLSLDCGFTCPNRDGSLSTGGCTFCLNNAFNPSYCNREKSVIQQLEEGKEFHRWRYKKAQKYLAYFQAYSNTYAPLDKLKTLYETALDSPDVIGLVIGTRGDCVDEKKLDYIEQLSKRCHVVLEYGIESCYNDTLKRINRATTIEKTQWAVEKTKERGITVAGHLIFFLPGESKEQMLQEADIVSQMNLDSIKFHQLQLIKGTAMIQDFLLNPKDFYFPSFDEYEDFVVDFLERLSPNIMIERFASEVPPRYRYNEGWGNIRNEQIVQRIEKRLQERNTYQGRLYKNDTK